MQEPISSVREMISPSFQAQDNLISTLKLVGTSLSDAVPLFQSESDLIQAKIDLYDNIDDESSKEPYWKFQMNVLSSDLCYRARNRLLSSEETALISTTLDSLVPSVYRNRKRVPISTNHWNVSCVQGGNKCSSELLRDYNGNVCLMSCIIFLNNGVSQSESMNENRFLGGMNSWEKPRYIEMPSIKGAGVVFDSRTNVSFGEVIQGCKYVIVVNCMFDVLPHNYFCSKNQEISQFYSQTSQKPNITPFQMDYLYKITDELMTVRRALMKRAFTNSFDVPTAFYDANLDRRHNVKFECCQNCNSYIPVESTVCNFCNDTLISDPFVVQVRKKDGWIAK